MAYQCERGRKECDGCGQCSQDLNSGLICGMCNEPLREGDCYYEIDGVAICNECIRLARRIA